MYFRNYDLAKTRLDKYLKSAVSQCTSTTNMVTALKAYSNTVAAPLSYLLITANDIEVENVTLDDMQNVMTVC